MYPTREKGRCAMYEPTLPQIGFEDFGQWVEMDDPCDCEFAFTETHAVGAKGCECNEDGSLRPVFKFPTVPVRKDLLWDDLTACAVEQAQRQFEADEVARLEAKIERLREES